MKSGERQKRFLLLLVILSSCVSQLFAQYSLSGRVLNSRNQEPVEFAVVSIPVMGLWSTANIKGEFIIKNIPVGKFKIVIQYLGFVKKEYEYQVSRNLKQITFLLDEDNLVLSQVEVTAKKGEDLSTSFVMDRKALDHLQMLNVTDATALLPGGKTNKDINLATNSPQRFSINSGPGDSERGNPTFGVAVEVDGVRLSNNSFRDLAEGVATRLNGPDTRNISPGNVESIEVVTGIPSVEHGDMTNGMVRINTRKGLSPYILELSTRPNSKQVSLSKGLNLGKTAGVLNYSIDYTKSISNPESPYTTYDRNSLSLNYLNTINRKSGHPLTLNFGVSGNIGGYDSKKDPDLFLNTYEKVKDNVLRSNLSLKWLLEKSWITNLEVSGTLSYNDKLSEISSNQSATASVASIRTKKEGYHVGELYDVNPDAPVILIPRGSWYEIKYGDNKLINYNGRLKATWFRKIAGVSNNLMLGGDLNVSGNLGKGRYYNDLRYAPTWREYRLDQESFIRNYSLFAENTVNVPVRKSVLQLVAGIRSEITSISGSEYGTLSHLSPRFNAKYTFWEKSKGFIEDLSLKAGWGKTVKLPGFDALYATPSYRDILTFAPGTTTEGETFYAYYSMQRPRIFNPDLKWQSNVQKELVLSTTIKGTRIYLTASQDKTANPYLKNDNFSPFFYKFTSQTDLERSTIPIANRIYTVDKNTGIVTVTDKTGAMSAETLTYTSMYSFVNSEMYENGSPVTRNRFTWTVDFKQIKALRSSLKVDGNFYHYKGIEKAYSAYMPNVTLTMADGRPYKYIGFFIGGNQSSNGEINRSMDMNFTVTTHIPAVRLILTARLEGSFYKYTKRLSEKGEGARSFVIDSQDDFLPSATQTDIYGGNRFVGLYPEYYVSLDDLNQKIPFAEKFIWAKTNDPALYNELSKLVVKTNYDYIFNTARLSDYYSANLAITKEVGRFASISFFANNFFNNMAKVYSSWAGTESSLFNTSYIPAFNYGASLRLKI